MRDSMIFYRGFMEAIADQPPEVFKRLTMAALEYGLDGIEPNLSGLEKAVFVSWRPVIDVNNQRYENGKKGGRPKKQTITEEEPKQNQTKTEIKPNENQTETKAKPSETEPKPNVNVNVNENVNENDNEKEKESPNGDSKKKNPKPVKHKYGSFGNVLLTDDQYTRVQEEFPLDYDERIEELSEGIELHGYKYKNHYLALRKWAKKRDQELGRSSPTQKRAAPAKRGGVDRTGLAISPGYHDVDDAELYEVF